MPIVPPNYGKQEMHPVVLLKETPVAALVGISPLVPLPPVKGVEFAKFENKFIIVNHRSSPLDIRRIKSVKEIQLVASVPGHLAAHSATYLEIK